MDYLQDIYFTNLNVVYNTGGFFRCEPTYKWQDENQIFDQNKFYCITEGRCTIVINDKVYNAKAGDWFFIPAFTSHGFNNDKGLFKKFWLHCDFYPNKDIFALTNLPYYVNFDLNGNVPKLFDKLVKSAKSDLLADKIIVKATLLELFAEYVKLAHPNGVSVKSDSDNRFDDLLRFINENLNENFSNALLAEKCFLSPNHFIKCFKDLTGQTPASYIKQRKMECAKRMLENTDLDISNIAEKVGIYDVSHFCKIFKSFYEKSPKEHRKYYKSTLYG